MSQRALGILVVAAVGAASSACRGDSERPDGSGTTARGGAAGGAGSGGVSSGNAGLGSGGAQAASAGSSGNAGSGATSAAGGAGAGGLGGVGAAGAAGDGGIGGSGQPTGGAAGAGNDGGASGAPEGGSGGTPGGLDPYTWCVPALGALENPRCTFPDSTCGNPWCTPVCAETQGTGDDCPEPLTGDADRACYFNQCALLCGDGQTCPDGMECSVSTCRWSITCGIREGEGDEPAHRLTILASGFGEYEFAYARIVVESDVHSAIGKVQIRGGAFEWASTGLLDEQAEVAVAVYVDKNADDACEAGEPAWEHITQPVTQDTVVELSPGSAGWSALLACATSGGADLTTPRPCTF